MELSEPAVALLRAVLAEREALVDQATDKVFFESPDLAGKRPRIVTRMLVDRVFAFSVAALLRGDESEVEVFIDQMTGIRSESDYHVSTLLAGFRSFRFAIEAPLRRIAPDGWIAWEVITAADDLFVRSASRAADLLIERQNAALVARKAQVERDNARLTTELRVVGETSSILRAELEANTVTVLHLEQELREKNATIKALTEGDRGAREILERLPPGPERLDALRELRGQAEKTGTDDK